MTGPLLARKDLGDLMQSREFLEGVGILCGVLLAGAVLLSLAQRWRRRQGRESSDAGQLTTFREMLESGELSQEEYEKIRGRVAQRVKEKSLPKVSKAKPTESPPTEL